MNSKTEERSAFAQRLQHALIKTNIKISPTALARIFNSVTVSEQVTIHAVRKWLLGQAIPTQEKLRVLSRITGFDANWLRMGNADEPERTVPQFSAEEHELLGAFRTKLDARERAAVIALIRALGSR